MAESSFPGKKEEVASILQRLADDLQQKQESRQQSLSALSRLKVLGREASAAKDISEKRGLKILANYGIVSETDEAALEALRCTANALLLVPSSRQMFADLGLAPKVSNKLFTTESSDAEFLFSRILFLLTYDTRLDFEDLAVNFNLREAILKSIARYASAIDKQVDLLKSPIDTMAISESLKLLFNITYFNPSLSSSFSPAISDLFQILRTVDPLPKPPLEPPIGHIINALLNLDLADNTNIVFASNGTPEPTNVAKLTQILKAAVSEYPIASIDEHASPLISLFRDVYAIAPLDIQEAMQHTLLPSDAERNQPLGRSDSLPSRLLRLSTTARTPELRDLVLGLMFDLSGKEASRFVQNVGYGYASGFLVNHNIATAGGLPRGDVDGNSGDVNFVTGQYLAEEEPARDVGGAAEMSEEEKLREAERLFVLFERLKRTGVVDVQNPIEVAARSGRLEELDDE